MTPTLNTGLPAPVPVRRDDDAAPQEGFVNLLFATVAPVRPVLANAEPTQDETAARLNGPADTSPSIEIGGGPEARPSDDMLPLPPAFEAKTNLPHDGPLPPEFQRILPTPLPAEQGKGTVETKPRLGPALPGPDVPTSSVSGASPAVDVGNTTDAALAERDASFQPRTALANEPGALNFALLNQARVDAAPKIGREKNATKPNDATADMAAPVAAISEHKAPGPPGPHDQLAATTERLESFEPVRIAHDEPATPDHRGDGEAANIVDTILRKFSDTFAGKIEAATTHAKADPRPEKLIEQLAPRMAEIALPEGGDRRLLKMRLHPAELGSVEIELEKDAGGTLTARIHTESVAAQHILVEGLDQLRDSLQNSGWTVGDLQVGIGSGSTNDNEPGDRGRRKPSVDHRVSGESSIDFPSTQDAAHADGLVSLRA